MMLLMFLLLGLLGFGLVGQIIFFLEYFFSPEGKSDRKSNIKYNLTLWQKISLPTTHIEWAGLPFEDRKSWHEVKKGMEKHEHSYTVPITIKGYDFLKCEHEGCYMCDPVDKI